MVEQKERARRSSKFLYQSNDTKWTIVGNEQPTLFTGYEEKSSLGNIIKYKLSNEYCEVVLDQTPFYAESGGQIGDTGYLKNNGFSMKVEDVQKVDEDFVHIGVIESGNIQEIESVDAQINKHRRKNIQRNHTATHLMHQALKDVLGEHVQQAGSLVAPNSLRFDLTHYEQISNDYITEIEKHVNIVILENLAVQTEMKDYKTARDDGAVSLFGEKYGDVVRVVNIPGFSKELCGGTHVNRTGDIGGLKIISETALASGIRRLVAVTGEGFFKLLTNHEQVLRDIRNELKCSQEDVLSCLQSLAREKKHLEKENKKLKQTAIAVQIDDLVNSAVSLGELRLVVKRVDDPGDLKVFGDKFRHAFRSRGISLIGTIKNKKPMVLCAVTDDLTNQIHAGDIVKEMGGVMGGDGGGKSHIATAGGSDVNLLKDALVHGENLIKSILSGN
jgi:alanyl-tRNA synthetase